MKEREKLIRFLKNPIHILTLPNGKKKIVNTDDFYKWDENTLNYAEFTPELRGSNDCFEEINKPIIIDKILGE